VKGEKKQGAAARGEGRGGGGRERGRWGSFSAVREREGKKERKPGAVMPAVSLSRLKEGEDRVR